MKNSVRAVGVDPALDFGCIPSGFREAQRALTDSLEIMPGDVSNPKVNTATVLYAASADLEFHEEL